MTDRVPHSEEPSETQSEVMPKVIRETSAQQINLALIKNTKAVGIVMIIIGFNSYIKYFESA